VLTDQAEERPIAIGALPRLGVVLAPLDGSALAEVVVPILGRLGVALAGTVVLLHVLEREAPATVHGDRHLRDAASAHAYLTSVVVRLATAGVAATAHVHEAPEGDVARSIVQHTEELGGELIVLARHGSGGLRGLLFGRIAQQVVRRGRQPVLLVPATGVSEADAAWSPRSMAVALDGTVEAEAALAPAARVALALGLPPTLIFAVPTLGSVGGDLAPVATLIPAATRAALDLAADAAARYLERVIATLTGIGLAATGVVVRGDPASSIATTVEQRDLDLLALATHGKGGLGGAWSGSVGAKILADVQRPLLLVPAPTAGA
jgi:nucleotide-binding universal stress UspA family protein